VLILAATIVMPRFALRNPRPTSIRGAFHNANRGCGEGQNGELWRSMPSMVDGSMEERSGRLAVAELLLGGVRSRQTVPLLDQARGALDRAWTAIEQRSEAGGSLMSEADALEGAILERGRDDYTARAATAVVYAVRSLTSRC
jgi:hypothetical protein